MISIINTIEVTDPSVVSTCSLGLTRSSALSLRGIGVSGGSAVSPLSMTGLPVWKRNERPTEAPEAAVVKGQASVCLLYTPLTQHHHKMWAFRGPEPWSDPA
ncbi:hypothetical protein [Streptomyces sp. NRRL S-15]|uniref:hypothetical protein n=1 Tax=Streptomyces sp. NRRL S-15 TaxID=1463886 RepID=UPI0004CC0FED|nr:hypothetical protein [Streptomyces sp. NRRL S-15]